MTRSHGAHSVAGIDVGGHAKGAHLVILRAGEVVAQCSKQTPDEMLRRCLDWNVMAVGIDAPSRWASAAGPRHAETALARQRVSLFSTPTRERAGESRFYQWMFAGEAIYAAFLEHYPLLRADHAGRHAATPSRVCFETFPHAITCAMLGRDVARAAEKRVQRRSMLENAGIDTRGLKSIDDLDAALCAFTAGLLLDGKVVRLGDEDGGYIVVPDGPAWRPAVS